MRMSEFKGTEKMKMFVKFVEEKHLHDVLSGKLYMNNIKYFIDLEKKEKNKGVGDRKEAGFVTKPDKMYVLDMETDKIISRPVNAEITLRHQLSPKVPVFCFTEFTAEDFVYLEEDEEYITFKLDLGEDSQKMFDFGDKAVILAPEFSDKVVAASKKQDIKIIMKEVEYQSYDKGDLEKRKEKRKLFEQGSSEMFFWKSEEFSYQREARLVLFDTFVERNYIFEVGSLKGSTVIPIKDFFEKSVVLFRKDVLKDS